MVHLLIILLQVLVTISLKTSGSNTVDTGTGVDTVYLGSGVDNISAGAGNDIIGGATDLDIIDGGEGTEATNILYNFIYR